MANNPRIDIGVRVDYKDVLEQMKLSFKKELTEISNHAKKTNFDADIEKKLKQIDTKVDNTFGNFEKKFDELSNQTIKTENFEKYQRKVSKMFDDVRSSVSGTVDDISKLREEVKMLSGADFALGMKKQFDDLCQDVKKTHSELLQVLDMTQSSSGDSAIVKQYSKPLNKIRTMKEEIKKIDSQKITGDEEDIEDQYFAKLDNLDEYFDKYKELKKKLSTLSKEDSGYGKLENDLINQEILIKRTIATIQQLNGELEDISGYSRLDDETLGKFKIASSFDKEIDDFAVKIEKLVSQTKEATEQIQGEFSTFRMKDGAIHIPIDIATNNEELKNKVKDIVEQLKSYVDNTPIIAKVKLTLDKRSSSGYKNNAEIDKQQIDDANKPALDLAGSINKVYRDAAREAEAIVKQQIIQIQNELKEVKIKLKLDDKALMDELSKVVDSSLKKIAKNTTGLNVNSELEKLVANLEKVSTSLTGNENFKFGLDEASIERITAAIRGMADMIQRAFGVASNEDIAAQWTAIESKFKGVAGEEGKLLKGNKEHKIAIQELAVEYKKYLDMGGKNDLSKLTTHKQTVKNITAEYENLGKAAQEAAQKQEKAVKKPKSTKVSTEEAEAAAEKFRKLAKEKGAAVVANRELAKAAKETADALEREAKARKSGAGKTNPKAVDEDVYGENYSTWQRDIKQELLDSGEYAEVYGAKISRAENGNVKFTASVKTMTDAMDEAEGEWKEFTASVNSSGEISSPSLKEVSAKKSIALDKELELWRQLSESIFGENEEPKNFNADELRDFAATIIDATQSLETFNTKYKVLVSNRGGLSIIQEITKDDGKIETFTARFKSIEDVIAAITDETKSFKQTLEESFDSGSFSTSTKDFVSKAQEAFDKFTLKHKGDSNWSDIADDMREIEQRIAGINSQKGLDEFKQDLSGIALRLDNIGKDNKLGKIIDEGKTFNNINEVRANIDSLFSSMGKVNEKSIVVKGTDKLTAEVKAANGEIRKMTVSLDSQGFARFVDNGIVQFGRLRAVAEGVFKGIKDMVRIYLSPQDFIRYFRQGFDAVKEVDTAMTELKKVSDAPMGDIVAYLDDAVESAKELGSSVNEMIGATADWQRMGYNLPDSRELGEVAVLYKNVGDGIDVDTANESLVSTIQGFQLQAKDAMSVIDAFNEVSNNYAISSGGMGEALKRSAAAFNAANTDLNQAIALITAGNEIVQSPEKVGTMWQTVSARIRGTKSELEELGEATDDVLSTSKLRSLVMGYTNVDIMKDKDTYKDIYTIVSEIGEKWKDLKDIERAALLEGLAGKKQSNTLAAVLNNYERLEKIYQTAEQSSGSALEEQNRYTQSLQYSLDQLTAHGEEFWNTFINKDDVKDFIDIINTLISRATKLVDIVGSIPTVAGILGGFASLKNVGINMLVAYLSNLYCFELPTI